MYNWNKKLKTPVSISLALLSVSCGGQSSAVPTGGSSYYMGSPTGTGAVGVTTGAVTSTVAGATGSTTSGSTSGSSVNLPPPITSTFSLQNTASSDSATQLSGGQLVCKYDGSAVTPSGTKVGSFMYPAANNQPIYPDSILKVTVTSQSASTFPCTTATAYYTCEQFKISLIPDTAMNSATPLSSVISSQTVTVSYGNPLTGPCAGVPNSQTIDFSSIVKQRGHGGYAIVVSQPQYDNCSTETGPKTVINSTGQYVYFAANSSYCPVKSYFNGYGYAYYNDCSGITVDKGIKYAGCNMLTPINQAIVNGQLAIHTDLTQ